MARTALARLGLLLAAKLGCAGAPEPAPPGPPNTSTAQLANPASQHCVNVGGTLRLEARPDGGQYGVCHFREGRQCEEWALFRGECPEGGVPVAASATVAGRYCAISGGQYAVTGSSGTPLEKGTCTLPGGKSCAAEAFYQGTCTR